MSLEPSIIYIDGASRGNPGPAAFAIVIKTPHGETVEEHGILGDTTNNIAEYTALVRALEKAASLSLTHLHLHSDSELLVKQMNGEYQVKNADLRDLYDQAQELLGRFRDVNIRHVRREHNKRADELCNIALDAGKPKSPKKERKEPASSVSSETVHADCIECLEAARRSWIANDPRAPTAAQVWDQLWNVLEEGGALKKRSK